MSVFISEVFELFLTEQNVLSYQNIITSTFRIDPTSEQRLRVKFKTYSNENFPAIDHNKIMQNGDNFKPESDMEVIK